MRSCMIRTYAGGIVCWRRGAISRANKECHDIFALHKVDEKRVRGRVRVRHARRDVIIAFDVTEEDESVVNAQLELIVALAPAGERRRR